MTNDDLANDYLIRAKKRLSALEALFAEEAWADVVRESQEVVELALKGLLRNVRIFSPHTHDVSAILATNKNIMPLVLQEHIDDFCKISRSLRRDREMAFYGSEDLTPSTFYQKEDAEIAKANAHKIVALIFPCVVKFAP